ncbi:hypothetical protein [Methanonatronarchaeum sp. AMET-Sl]|uniref:hypothetical protein n=1 Tax=Methanonatronarchaeum sp. AMET-Sl TaxID=3037654 RepID=UPI00244DC580|nr:hypothetical protein [Methanonatronarchaeum sp. AMET-Sl]WGI17147.1 hypothetical protein QEN48_06505 [Methanonatronarchaeum sp. AMET-Sl]
MSSQLLSKLEDTRKDIIQCNNKLKEKEKWIENKALNKWKKLSEDDKNILLKEIEGFKRRIEKDDSTESIIEIIDDLNDSFKEPILKSARRKFKEFIESIDLKKNEKEMDYYREMLSQQKNLEENIKYYQDSKKIIEDSSDIVFKNAKNKISSETKRDWNYLLEPEKIKKDIEKFIEREQELEEIKKTLKNLKYENYVDSSVLEVEDLWNLEIEINSDKIVNERIIKLEEKSNNIGEKTDSNFDLNKIICNSISSILNHPPRPLSKGFEEVYNELKTIEEKIEYFDLINNLNNLKKTSEEIESLIDLKTNSGIKEGNIDTKETIEKLNEMEETFEDFKSNKKKEYHNKKLLCNKYESTWGFEVPKNLFYSANSSFVEEMESKPSKAIRKIRKIDEWISDKETELREKIGDETLRLWEKLENGEHIPLSEVDFEKLKKLDDAVQLEIRLKE